MVYTAPVAQPAASSTRGAVIALAAGAVVLCVSFSQYGQAPAFVAKEAANATILSTTALQQVESNTPWLNDTEKAEYSPPVCEAATLARVGSAIAGMTFTTDALADQGRTAVCSTSARDTDGQTVNNGETDERAKIEGMLDSGVVPDKAQFVPGGSRRLQGYNFDVDLYLKESNPRERQHRLLCMVEASEAPIEAGATDPALGRLQANKDKWSPVLEQQQSDCGQSLSVDMALPSASLRSVLKNFTDTEAVSMLQCRAKASDTRTCVLWLAFTLSLRSSNVVLLGHVKLCLV
jgi:hypothetical protein